jgi:metal-sulfur cluster biosynthetic enzyme
MISERIEALPGLAAADVEVVWDEPWTVDRLSDTARRQLRFLPTPRRSAVIGDALVFDCVAHVFNFEK